MKCSTCVYWHSTNGRTGDCRREIPHAVTRWPKTGGDDSCGASRLFSALPLEIVGLAADLYAKHWVPGLSKDDEDELTRQCIAAADKFIELTDRMG